MNRASIERDFLNLQLLSIHRISWIWCSLFRNPPQISPPLSCPTCPWAPKLFPSMTALSKEFQSPLNKSFKDNFIALHRFLRKTTCKLPTLQEQATDFCSPCYQTYLLYRSVCFHIYVLSRRYWITCIFLKWSLTSLQQPPLTKNTAAIYCHIIAFSWNLLIFEPHLQSATSLLLNFISLALDTYSFCLWFDGYKSLPNLKTKLSKNIPVLNNFASLPQHSKYQHVFNHRLAAFSKYFKVCFIFSCWFSDTRT